MAEEGTAPPPGLAAEIAALRATYADLRARLLERAAEARLEIPSDADAWATLGDLEPLLAALERAQAERAEVPHGAPAAGGESDQTRHMALEAAVQRALVVLSQVLAVRHRDDPAFQPLLECQARASDLRVKLSRLPGSGREVSPQRVDETLLPFADLLTLVTGPQELDDQRWMEAEENVARVFGRQLAIAATRGRLVLSPPGPRAPEGPVSDALAAEAEPASGSAGDLRGWSLPLPDPRGAGVTWWTAAHGAWVSWKRSGMALAHALRAVLARHPYLLSVPIRQSADYDRGRLASGYFLLLEHVEHLRPSFLRTAVERALDRVAQTRDPGVLGPALYDLLVREGRLTETYPDFVREVMIAAIPTPGVWLDAIITESDEATLVVTRPGHAPGEPGEVTRTLTEPAARQSAHRMTLVVAPLTTRFVCLRRGELREPRDVTITLTAQGAPTEEAWLLVLRSDYLMHAAPRRPEGPAVTLSGFGRSWSALWVAVFNRDPEAERRVELAATIRPCVPAGPRQSVFGLKAR
jgi:hypothetical protein